MKKRINRIVSLAVVFSLIMGTNMYAALNREVITVKKDMVWNKRPALSRSGSYNDVYARAFSVYPINGGTDTFRYLQVKVENTSGTAIVESTNGYILLNENNTDATHMLIKNGYLKTSTVVFSFRGNTAEFGAKADVKYSAR